MIGTKPSGKGDCGGSYLEDDLGCFARHRGDGRLSPGNPGSEWRERSHAWHMAERFLAGYPVRGRWHRPAVEVVSAYVDQFPATDLSRARAKESGFTIYPSVAAALRRGTDRLAVDAVLIIGEHGDYPVNEFGQKKYPRYEFFRQVVEVFQADGGVRPVFNDKHLSWNWDWAKKMYDTSRELGFAFQAGSSLAVTWRVPSVNHCVVARCCD